MWVCRFFEPGRISITIYESVFYLAIPSGIAIRGEVTSMSHALKYFIILTEDSCIHRWCLCRSMLRFHALPVWSGLELSGWGFEKRWYWLESWHARCRRDDFWKNEEEADEAKCKNVCPNNIVQNDVSDDAKTCECSTARLGEWEVEELTGHTLLEVRLASWTRARFLTTTARLWCKTILCTVVFRGTEWLR